MITKIIDTATNLKSILVAKSTYFIVKEEILLQGIQYVLGTGSVIEFSGGCFRGTFGTSLNLNGGQVIADPYPIFTNMEVTGIGNNRVYAEWFNDNNSTAAHIYINKALRMAKGCPVVLAQNVYKLTGTIVFPNTSPSTLIAAGSLEIDDVGDDNGRTDNPVAIDINVSNVTIYINRIKFPERKLEVVDEEGKVHEISLPTKGTAIRVSGQVMHASINVNKILYPERGIDISPGRDGTYANVQYLNVRFQDVYAIYCIYFDIYSKGIPSKNWVTRSTFNGGRLRGDYGIYMAENTTEEAVNGHINELCFSNIGLEGFDKSPLYLSSATRLKFENIRMAESMPAKDYPWICLKDISWVDFYIHGGLNADKIEASGVCSHIKIRGEFLQNTDWIQSPFDTLVIDTVWVDNTVSTVKRPQKVLTSSVKPFPMSCRIENSGNLQEIQPTIIPEVPGKFNGLKVLPRTLQFSVDKETVINLTGLRDYASCIFYFYVTNNIKLTFESSEKGSALPLFVNDVNASTAQSSLTIYEKGIYRLIWVTCISVKEEGNSEMIKEANRAVCITKLSN